MKTDFGHAGAVWPATRQRSHLLSITEVFLNILMCVRHEFDSDLDFKAKVADEDAVVGKIQNDELCMVQKCFIFLNKIEDLKVLGCHGKAKMS